jgi:N6-adenosine-specific RNA methylase IME4
MTTHPAWRTWDTWLHPHPAAEAFPRLDADALRILADDIKQRGQKEPCTYIKDEEGLHLLDGINRLDARELAGLRIDINDRAVFEQLSSNIDVIAYVVSKNINRRHLDESQRAMVAAKLATLNLGANQHRGEGPSIEGASRLLNVGHASVERAKLVRREGISELVQAVERGNVKVSVAADITSLSKDEQRALLANFDEGEIRKAASKIHTRRMQERLAQRHARVAALAEPDPLPRQHWPVALVDPPIKYEDFSDTSSRSPAWHYPTMTLEQLCQLRVDGRPVSDLFTPSAAVFITLRQALMLKADALFHAWGLFTYVAGSVWDKGSIGAGSYFRYQHELLLLVIRGKMPPPLLNARPPSVFRAPRGGHSEKPEIIYQMIERMYPNLPRIELFARGEARPGWTAWGNEAPAPAALAGGAA